MIRGHMVYAPSVEILSDFNGVTDLGDYCPFQNAIRGKVLKEMPRFK